VGCHLGEGDGELGTVGGQGEVAVAGPAVGAGDPATNGVGQPDGALPFALVVAGNGVHQAAQCADGGKCRKARLYNLLYNLLYHPRFSFALPLPALSYLNISRNLLALAAAHAAFTCANSVSLGSKMLPP